MTFSKLSFPPGRDVDSDMSVTAPFAEKRGRCDLSLDARDSLAQPLRARTSHQQHAQNPVSGGSEDLSDLRAVRGEQYSISEREAIGPEGDAGNGEGAIVEWTQPQLFHLAIQPERGQVGTSDVVPVSSAHGIVVNDELHLLLPLGTGRCEDMMP